MISRNRITYACLLVLVVISGLASRRYPQGLPDFVATYAGDTLWALTVFLVIGLIFPRMRSLKVAGFSLFFSVLIELSQLYHAPWIETIRQVRLMALVLGRGFLWSDLVCYSLGIGAGLVVELLYRQRQRRLRMPNTGPCDKK